MADHEYDTDLVLWSQHQARALRNAAGSPSNLPIDWENVAEEIETLGKSQSRELASRISTVLIHLLKLQVSPSADLRAGRRSANSGTASSVYWPMLQVCDRRSQS